MLKATLNLKNVDPESFGKEYVEQSLKAADALMDELNTADPELPKCGKLTPGANSRNGPPRRKADRKLPEEPQRSRCRRQWSATPSRRQARSNTPARSSGQNGGEERYDWREHQRMKKEAAEERESGRRKARLDTGHVQRRHYADYVTPTVPEDMKAWYQNVFSRRCESTDWE